MENRIQQETHHDDRFIFAKFVNEEACNRARKREREWVREWEGVTQLYLQLQLQQLLWPGQSVALSAPALSNKFSRATVEIGEEGGKRAMQVDRVEEIREKLVLNCHCKFFFSLSLSGRAFKVDFDDVLKLFNFLPRW